MEAETTGRGGSVLGFFREPSIGIAGSIASIVSLFLGVYFYQAGRQSRDLRYFVHPAKAIVVKIGESSRLRITLHGAPVERDVTATQVAFWNEGGESIRPEHMLRPLLIRMGPNSKILEARVRKVHRDVSNITLDLSRIGEGEVLVSWKILERYDGGILQLVYLGDADAPISATAIIEGQGDIRAIESGGGPRGGDRWATTAVPFVRFAGYFLIAMGVLMVAMAAYRLGDYRFSGTPVRSAQSAYLVAGVLVVAQALYVIFVLGAKPGPPFGFE